MTGLLQSRASDVIALGTLAVLYLGGAGIALWRIRAAAPRGKIYWIVCAALLAGGLSISGLFDLEPIRQTPFLQPDLRLTPAAVRRLSPAYLPAPNVPLYATVGGDETEEFLRQNELIRDRWGAAAVPVCEAVPGFHHLSVLDDLTDPPPWTRRPDVWRRAFEIARGPVPGYSPVLCHRDFHPGNVLWHAGRVTGVVDWTNTCRGPAACDVAHCRNNLALLFGLDAADDFARRRPRRG